MSSLPLSLEDLRVYLKNILPNSRLTDTTVDSAYDPVLLLQTNHIIAAFAFSNEDMRESYDALYGGFKKYYSEKQGQLDAFDLVFVFCVSPNAQNLDQFCSNIETDVYFCRKFVIPLISPLGASLSRLPFLPLTPLNGKSLRPPSAQTFLQQCGVSAVLAKFLVVQHERGPERILEDCITEKFGIPGDLTPTVNVVPVEQSEQHAESVRIKTVTIENFRAYRKPQIFEMGTDVTVLYGPNGFGKTSFFDAIDFAVTGGIARIESSNDKHFVKTVQHLDSKSEESKVSISFQGNGTVRKITRNVSDRKHALLDDRSTDRKAILTELTGSNMSATDRIENFVSLFRASHLFSQELQELTKDFQDDCQLPAEIVSRMLAFEDYANAVNKTARVCEILHTILAEATKEIREVSDQIVVEKKEFERLSQGSKGNANIEALDKEINAIRAKLMEAGIPVASQKFDAAMLRGWRAMIESRRADNQSMSERLLILAKEVSGLPRINAEFIVTQQQLTEKEKIFNTIEERRKTIEIEIQRAEQHLPEMFAKCTEVQTHAIFLEWVRDTKPIYAQLIEKQHLLNDEIQRMADALAQQRLVEEKTINELYTREAIVTKIVEQLTIHRTELVAIQNLQESITPWQANQTRLTAVFQLEQAEFKSLESFKIEEQDLLPQINKLSAEESRLSRQIAEVDKNQSELRTLVSQLQGHVSTGTCPLCGEEHGSKDKLILRIQKHVAADGASSARLDLTNVRQQLKQLNEHVAIKKQKQGTIEAQLISLKKERAKLENEINQFVNTAVNLGIAINDVDLTPIEQVKVKISQIQKNLTDLEHQSQEEGVAIASVRSTLANLKSVVSIKSAEMIERKAVLTRLQEDSRRLSNDPRLTKISLDIDSEQLFELINLNSNFLSGLKAEIVKCEEEIAKKKLEVSPIQQEANSLKTQFIALRSQITNFQKMIAQIHAQLKEVKLPVDTNEENLLGMITEQSRVQTQLLSLRDSASNLELAIDAATTAAALTSLNQNIKNKEMTVKQAVEKREQHQPWLKYFDSIFRLISSEQNVAIANFTKEYGPRTSIIQRRLRTVYGFDEIEIQSHASTINVRVKRHGEELRPIDYFSQSQQQTLLLGLFLTASSSQTWSTFSPIFLDDPVTHFDDLNTYAFLDLLVGLLDSEFGKRQFIISTCDEKLLQLARQKFHRLGSRAKFYRFSAIGKDGPVVEKITSS